MDERYVTERNETNSHGKPWMAKTLDKLTPIYNELINRKEKRLKQKLQRKKLKKKTTKTTES